MKKFFQHTINKTVIFLQIPFIITLFMVLLSLTGLLENLELTIFDNFFRIRSLEIKDDRIVIVGIDDDYIEKAPQYPLSDAELANLLGKIKAQQPRLIGLDIIRNVPVGEGYEELNKLIESTPNLIGVEKSAKEKIASLPILKKLDQVAFADVIPDKDGKQRRALISLGTDDGETQIGLSTKLALEYLAYENISLEVLDAEKGKYKLGKTIFTPLKKNDGGYINANVGGYQILLNYLGKPCLSQNNCIFKTVTITDILENKIAPDFMKNKIVLIGVTAKSEKDFFYNPYSYSENTTISGIEIHAHLISVLLRSALEKSYLIKTLPEFVEWFWVFSWAFIASLLGNNCAKKRKNISYLLVFAVLLMASSYILFLYNIWIPSGISFMTFIITSTTSLIYTLWQNLNISYSKLEDYASSLEEKVNEKTQDLIHKQQALELQNIQLLEARKIAENANKAKSNFLASMSHELRTPLNAIIGYSELLVEEAEDTGEVELINDLNKIKNSGVHLLGLINDILDLSKIEAGKTTLDENQCNLSHVLESIKEILVIKAEEKNLSFVLNIDKNIPQCILTDEKRIKQILINLLNNSIKFTKQGSVGLKVYLPQETENILDYKKENYQKVFFEVTDTGAGIKKEELYKLFEPFEQTETGKNAAESTGLGLAISKKLINLLGGDIWVESEVNKGTTFTFYIQAKDIVRSHLKNLHHD